MGNENCYIAREKCGCITIFLSMSLPPKDLAKEISKAVRDGMVIEQVTVGFARENFGQTCESCKAQEPNQGATVF